MAATVLVRTEERGVSGPPMTGACGSGMSFHRVNGRELCPRDTLGLWSLPTTWALVLSCLAELWSSVTRHPRISLQEGCCPKPVPHRGNQPYCSCRGKQAPGLVPLRFCCRAPGCTKGRMTLKCFPLERQPSNHYIHSPS